MILIHTKFGHHSICKRGKMFLHMTNDINQHYCSWFRTLRSLLHGYQGIRIISPQVGDSSFLKNTDKTLQDYFFNTYFVDRAARYKFLLITNLMHCFTYLFISSLYMFRASQCSSSGGRIVLIHHLV